MSTYQRKAGPIVRTTTIYDKKMNKYGLSKLIEVIPIHPAYKSQEATKALIALFGKEIVAALRHKKSR